MDAVVALPEFRLPSEPYPGLRPFLDHESSLLFGRARQVREIIEHLRLTKFVAVIGGSGSGKSSLIHAGVVPELRSFGLPGAGDFWIPMVCTPGTNAAEPKPGRPRHTPITRLAWKFARLLRSRGSAEADAARLLDIAAVFRQDAGFARLVEAYADELAAPPGPDPKDARLLFVIDQFEELFHPTNKESDDARLMVERVIDHFFSPHPRCYVVLTMRSEHLNDCASYLQLPDAINKSSYLVRRLDEAELLEAIKAPAQRFLRLLQRQKAHKPLALPAEVSFDDAVLARLLRDVKAITHDPDHLPLLQHLLARVWEMACRRARIAIGGVPAAITWADMVHAVLASDVAVVAETAGASDAAEARNAEVLNEQVNVLRASLENWAEAIFQQRSAAEQDRIEALLKHLAFKDPNTGTYSQQQVNVDDARLLGHDGKSGTPAALKALLEDPEHGHNGRFGYLGSVDYLFWDEENPQRVTLKVSHESFIRGWPRFRVLVDKEAERFDAFVDLLQRCERWSLAKLREAAQPGAVEREERRSERLLLESADLDRANEERLHAVLSDAEERADWFKVLRLYRDGPRLLPYDAELDAFIDQSRQRQHSAAWRASWLRRALVGTLVLALLLVPFLLFSVLVQTPVKERAELFFDATAQADQARQANNQYAVGDAAQSLRPLLGAADKVAHGRSEGGSGGMRGWQYALSASLMDAGSRFEFVRAQSQFLGKVAGQSEPRVNGELRLLLSSALWVGKPPDEPALPTPSTKAGECTVTDNPGDGSPPGPVLVTGRLYLPKDKPQDALQLGLFIPDVSSEVDRDKKMRSRREDVLLLGAVVDKKGGCTATEMVLPVPRAWRPSVLFDATLTHLLVATVDPVRDSRAVTLYGIDWQPTAGLRNWRAETRQLVVITDPASFDLVDRQAAQGGIKMAAMPTWHVLAGRVFGVGGQHWRMVSDAAKAPALAASASDADWLPLNAKTTGPTCLGLGKLLAGNPQPGFRLSAPPAIFEQGRHCFEVRRGRPTQRGPKTGAAPVQPPPQGAEDMQFEDVLVAVYDRPNLGDLADPGYRPPTAVASLSQFGRFGKTRNDWFIGRPKGRYDGWIALRHASDGGNLHFALPWSTAALARFGSEIEADQPKAPALGLLGASDSPRLR